MSHNSNEQTSRTPGLAITLLITSLAVFSSTMSIYSLNVAVPTIGSELAMKAVLLVWITNAVALVSAALFIPFGKLADIYGRKKIFFYGFCINIVASIFCGLANSGMSLIVFRLVQGIGGAMTMGTSVALLTSIVPAQQRGRALGIYSAALYCGIAGGPSLGGILTQHLGWRSIFYLLAFFGLIVVVLTLWKLKGDWAEAEGEKIDIAGSATLSVSIALIMYGFTGLPSITAIVLVLAGFLGMFIFVRIEAKTRYPVMDINVFKGNKTFIFSNLTGLLHLASISSVSFFASLYLQYIKGFPPQTAGFILLVQPILGIIFSVLAGRLSDKINSQIVASSGMLYIAIALSILSFLTETAGLAVFILCLAIVGFGQGFFATPNVHAIVSSVDSKYLGTASGTQQTSRVVGMVFGMGIIMIVFQQLIGETQITPEYYPDFMLSMKICFVISAVLSFIGVFLQLVGRKRKTFVDA